MATPTRKPQTAATSTPTPAATTTRTTTVTRPGDTASRQGFLFDRSNYMWMLGGLLLILIGFFLLAGGKSANPQEFNYDEIYSFRRITLAPLLMLIGFAIEAYAIMKKPKSLTDTTDQTVA
jgi:hypothetical protein